MRSTASFITALAGLASAIGLMASHGLNEAQAQMPNMELMNKWSKVNLIRYEVRGEITLKGFQIPPTDADLYADVTDSVRLSFDWDKKKGVIVGTPVITNEPARVSNLAGVDKGEPGKKRCPTGNINGAFEYFDVTTVRQEKPGPALELVGKRIHPETQVAEACGNKLRTYKGAVKEAKEYVVVPDPMILAYGGAQGVKTIQVTPDGKSIVMSALNNKWVWTFTPTAK
jgi:hypothetical protein